jgi:hypothetical protein
VAVFSLLEPKIQGTIGGICLTVDVDSSLNPLADVIKWLAEVHVDINTVVNTLTGAHLSNKI